jgi:hypothetical protein
LVEQAVAVRSGTFLSLVARFSFAAGRKKNEQHLNMKYLAAAGKAAL